MLNEIFNTDKYNSNIFVKSNGKSYTVKQIKELVKTRCSQIERESDNVVIFDDNNFSFIINFFAALYTNKTIFLVDSRQKIQNLSFDYFLLDSNIENKNSDFVFKKIDINKPAVNFFTSGTTSSPKIFQKSMYNLLKEAQDIKDEFNIKEDNLEFITSTILQHLFSLTFFLMFPIVNIEKKYIINTDKILYPDNIDINNSVFVSTPMFLEIVKKHNVKFIQNPKYIISAGSKLDIEIFKCIEKYSNIIEIYGSTESGVIAHKTKSNEDLYLFKNVKIEKNKEKTIIKSEYFPEEYIEIQDDIELKDGKIFIKKRKDNVLKIYDKRIYSDEIEEVLNKNDKILKSYCFKFKEKLACMAALSEEGKDFLLKNGLLNLKNNLKQYMRKNFEIVPQKWRFVDTVPANKRGKIDKEKIEKIFSVNFSFPVILDKKITENSLTYKLFFYKEAEFYKGHFPNFPITPGVAQLYLAEFLCKNFFLDYIKIKQVKKLKFSNIINPDSVINLELEKINDNIKFKYFDSEKTYSSAIFLVDNMPEVQKEKI